MKKNRLISFLSIMILIIVISPEVDSATGDLLIIAHKNTPVSRISPDALADIYSNSKTKWSNGDKIFVVMLKRGAVHEAFVHGLLGTTSKKLIAIWKRVIFTGVGTPPKIVRTEAEMLDYVANKKGSIGYISSKSVNNEVRVLSLR